MGYKTCSRIFYQDSKASAVRTEEAAAFYKNEEHFLRLLYYKMRAASRWEAARKCR